MMLKMIKTNGNIARKRKAKKIVMMMMFGTTWVLLKMMLSTRRQKVSFIKDRFLFHVYLMKKT
jgi:hypothetical protein